MGIRDMVVGGKYLAGDGNGYDPVECVEINPKETPEGAYGVKIKYLETGLNDFWFEMEGFSCAYVEPLFEETRLRLVERFASKKKENGSYPTDEECDAFASQLG